MSLQDFTLDDFCVLLIGENDFTESKDLSLVIEIIRQELLLVKHTNVIIMLPTFKCREAVNLFNYRIESFNNLLFSDNITHEYVYVIDSNKNLNYSSDMFNFYTGRPNNKALRTIFNDLANLISQFNEQDSNRTADKFFRH